MTANIDPFTALRSYLTQDFDEYQKQLASVDAERFAAALGAAFYIIVNRRFSSGRAAGDVIDLVAKVRGRFDDSGDEIDPQASERLIRAALGESELAQDLDERMVGRIESVFLAAMVDEEAWDETRLDEFLAEARTLADRWTS